MAVELTAVVTRSMATTRSPEGSRIDAAQLEWMSPDTTTAEPSRASSAAVSRSRWTG